MSKEKQPVRYETLKGYENLEGWYDYLIRNGKQVLALAYNDPFEIKIGEVEVEGEKQQLMQKRVRVWALLDDFGGMSEVSIKDVDVSGIELEKMNRDSDEMEEWLRNMFVIPIKPKGPYSKSSVPVIKADIDNYEDDEMAKRLVQLDNTLRGGMSDKTHKIKIVGEMITLMGGDLEKMSEKPLEIKTSQVAEMLGVRESTIYLLLGSSGNNTPVVCVEEGVHGGFSYSPQNIKRLYIAVQMWEKHKGDETVTCVADIGRFMHGNYTRNHELFRNDGPWMRVLESARELGLGEQEFWL